MQKVLASVVLVVVALALLALAWLRTGPALAEPAAEERAASPEPSTRAAAPITAPVSATGARAVQANEPERPAAPAPEPAAGPPAPDRATLVVSVTEAGRAVSQGTVEVCAEGAREKDEPLASSALATDGKATFEDLAPGKVVVRVADLEAELLPPRMQAKEHHEGVEVTLVPGPNEATLEVERRAFVYGTVRGVDGGLVDEELILRFSIRAPWERYVSSVDLSIREGHYEGHLYPGEWFSELLGAWSDVALNALSHRVARAKPAVEYRELGPGSVTRIDFVCVPGSSTLLGRILDDELRPFDGLPVIVRRRERLLDPSTGEWLETGRGVCAVTTGEDGRFSVAGLTAGLYTVVVETGAYVPTMRPEERRVGEIAQPKQVDVPDAGTAEIEFRLRRYRPTHFRARIDVDPAWARSQRLWGRVPSAVVVLEPNEVRSEERRVDLYSRENWLDFYLDLEGGSAYVELSMGGVTKVHPLFADGSEPGEFVIGFP